MSGENNKWTSVKPTEPGWYWVKEECLYGIYQITTRPGHDYLAIETAGPFGGRHYVNINGICADFSGPIPEPSLL